MNIIEMENSMYKIEENLPKVKDNLNENNVKMAAYNVLEIQCKGIRKEFSLYHFNMMLAHNENRTKEYIDKIIDRFEGIISFQYKTVNRLLDLIGIK